LETLPSEHMNSPTKKRNTMRSHTLTIPFVDNAMTRDIVHVLCAERKQSENYLRVGYYLSHDCRSHLRILSTTTPGVKLAYFRAEPGVHDPAICAMLSPWQVPTSIDEISPFVPAELPMDIFRVVASYAITPVLPVSAEVQHQRTALYEFLFWDLGRVDDDYEEQQAVGTMIARCQLETEARAEFMCQTDKPEL
jgi:hypothetical protein